MWNSRSPGVETAWWRSPASSTNGCRSTGRGPANRRSQAPEPIPATSVSPAVGARDPTVRTRPEEPAQRVANRRLRLRRRSSPPGRWTPPCSGQHGLRFLEARQIPGCVGVLTAAHATSTPDGQPFHQRPRWRPIRRTVAAPPGDGAVPIPPRGLDDRDVEGGRLELLQHRPEQRQVVLLSGTCWRCRRGRTGSRVGQPRSISRPETTSLAAASSPERNIVVGAGNGPGSAPGTASITTSAPTTASAEARTGAGSPPGCRGRGADDDIVTHSEQAVGEAPATRPVPRMAILVASSTVDWN